MTIPCLGDAQPPPRLAVELTLAGLESQHVVELGLLTAGDKAIWERADALGACIMSKDEDFVGSRQPFGRRSSAGLDPSRHLRSAELCKRIGSVLDQMKAALQAGERVVEIV